MLDTLRWLVPALAPVALGAWLVARTHLRQEPLPLAVFCFVLGGVGSAVTRAMTGLVMGWSGLDVRSSVVGEGEALLFMFCLVAPLGEVSKVAATWPAFRSDHLGDPYEGVIWSALVGLGFSSAETVGALRAHPTGLIWVARALLALPADVFFAALWGYALGRVKKGRRRASSIFPLAWLVATASHGLYLHIVYGRGPGAIVGVAPLLLAMGAVAWFYAREHTRSLEASVLRVGSVSVRTHRTSGISFQVRGERPSLESVRAALRRHDHPVMLRWILLGALVTMGAILAGLAASVAFGHFLHVDFSVVDEHDATTTAPLALLGAGVLLAFPISGFLVARASNVPTLLEPAIGSALAIACVCVLLALTTPIALVFAFAFSPIAFGLSCAGAWAGLPTG